MKNAVGHFTKGEKTDDGRKKSISPVKHGRLLYRVTSRAVDWDSPHTAERVEFMYT